MPTAAASRTSSPLERALQAGNWPARHPHGHELPGVRCGWSLWVVESTTEPGTDREITYAPDIIGDDLIVSCSCPAGRFDQPDCKHRAAVRFCMDAGIWATYCLCYTCNQRRVSRTGQQCADCLAKAASLESGIIWCAHCSSIPVEVAGEWCAECIVYAQEVTAAPKPLHRAVKRGRRVVAKVAAVPMPPKSAYPTVYHCDVCGERNVDPLHIAYCG